MSEAQGVSLKAVVVGFLADIIGSFALGIVPVVVLVAQGASPQAVSQRMQEQTGLVLSLVLGFMATLFGGFIAGRIARHSEVFHGGLVGIVGLLFGLLFVSHYPPWYNAVCFGGMVPCAMLGSWLAASPRKDVYERDRLREYEESNAGW